MEVPLEENDANREILRSIESYLSKVQDVLSNFPRRELVALVELLLRAGSEGSTIFVFGNGGSAATASHWANDLVKGTLQAGLPRLRAFALTDNVPLLTAWANDNHYREVFAQQLRSLARPGDVAIAISGSGKSENILEAIRAARSMGLRTVGLTGSRGGELNHLAELCIVVPSDEYGPIEDAHLVVDHLVTYALKSVKDGR